MNTFMAVLLLAALTSTPSPAQVPQALKGYLDAQSPIGPTARSVDYSISYKSSREGGPKGEFKDSGVLYIGTTRHGNSWVSAPQHAHEPQIGEMPPPSDGILWFNQAASPSRMAILADPATVLNRFVRRHQLKSEEVPSAGHGEPGDKVLVYTLEASRPAGKFWSFNVKAGEARLHVGKDGSPTSLEVIQAYEGMLSPHFGDYHLDRKETWVFSSTPGHLQISKYRLSLRRKDWKNSFEAEMEMTIGGLQ